MKHQIVNESIVTENFSEAYPYVNKYVIENGDSVSSRNGDTKEVIDFKTTLINPYKRCVGNNGRDINIFFLLAEAMWIFTGQKDVDFLTIFNSKMELFSDDGKVFHAPYGFRLRHQAIETTDKFTEENKHASQGYDQIENALAMLSKNPEDRRVVLSIWNTDLDLNHKPTKDIPCNDMIFLKVRDGKLRTTIANRSNDLHWGLPTNIFQFSFLTELMSNILGLELGTQTHNSQSLHIYTDSEIAWKMYENQQLTRNEFVDLYDIFNYQKIDTNFETKEVWDRLHEVDYHLNNIIDSVKSGNIMTEDLLDKLRKFSNYLFYVYLLLITYVEYKKTEKKDVDKLAAINRLINLTGDKTIDIYGLALNFFVSKITDKDLLSDLNLHSSIGKL